MQAGAQKEQQGGIVRFSRFMEGVVPDAITASIFFLVILFVIALVIGNPLSKTMDAYYKGLWMLLPFTMQMTLIITLSSVFGSTPIFRRIVIALSGIPRTAFQVHVVGILLVSILAYFYWGLAVALAPIIAVYFCNEAERKGIKVDFLFTLAVFYAAHSVWQYGLSASGPLLMATPGHFLEKTTGIMSLNTTIWSPAAVAMVIIFTLVLIIAARLFAPKNATPISAYPESQKLAEVNITSDFVTTGDAKREQLTYSERLERYTFITLILCAALLGWLYYHFAVKKLSLDLNSLNAIFLLLCFLLHKNVYNFTRALQEAVKSSWSVIIIYHLYAALAGIIQYTTVGESFATAMASVSTRLTFPLLAAIAGTIIAIFVPSSGGQWVIQGFVTSKAAAAIGVTYQRGMLALGIGDQMGNLMSPFWYVVAAGIARVDFRKFYGYGLVFSALWFVIGVLVFTLLPC
ncbi:MAG: TIGR00366 family protein [Peptococcaceae bacterium]|nr:TIGR00366 family protein [Peptococcaceae bacterium]